jgi:mRNA interferase RelE/StbE
MEIIFLNSFSKDIDKLKNAGIKADIADVIDDLKKAQKISDLHNVKKLKGNKGFYRIRIGDYRLGFSYENHCITLIRFLSRKDIYKYFP